MCVCERVCLLYYLLSISSIYCSHFIIFIVTLPCLVAFLSLKGDMLTITHPFMYPCLKVETQCFFRSSLLSICMCMWMRDVYVLKVLYWVLRVFQILFFCYMLKTKISRPIPTYPDHIDLSRPHRPFPTGRCWSDLDGVICGGGLNQEVEYLPIILQIYKINGNSGFEL